MEVTSARVIRHANAGSAVITLDRGADALTVTIRDDGRGAAEFVASNGIRGMSAQASWAVSSR